MFSYIFLKSMSNCRVSPSPIFCWPGTPSDMLQTPQAHKKFPIEWNKCSPTPYGTIFIQPVIAKAVTYNSFLPVFKTMLWWKRCIYSLTPRLPASHLGLICLFLRSSVAFCWQFQSLPMVSFRFSNSVVVVLGCKNSQRKSSFIVRTESTKLSLVLFFRGRGRNLNMKTQKWNLWPKCNIK